ncbi:hypothetical protein [Allocoleopsis sp.]|uniref:hypothetical protein n=1 Tax=Allocoleopsis sp. TaxID=3088169 RepID=UPI002FD0D3D3
MKKKYFNLRLSERRLNKLRVYAVAHDKTMTQVIEELIDGLSNPESPPDRDSSHVSPSR